MFFEYFFLVFKHTKSLFVFQLSVLLSNEEICKWKLGLCLLLKMYCWVAAGSCHLTPHSFPCSPEPGCCHASCYSAALPVAPSLLLEECLQDLPGFHWSTPRLLSSCSLPLYTGYLWMWQNISGTFLLSLCTGSCLILSQIVKYQVPLTHLHSALV